MKRQVVYTEILPQLYWAGFVQALLILATLPMPEMGDLRMFKLWAIQAHLKGIDQAFVDPEFRYDWLPLYLYVSKVVGTCYAWSGLADGLGLSSRVLSVLLKSTMLALHLTTAYLVYVVCRMRNHSEHDALLCCQMFLWNPGILVATILYGYQDAFHTMLIVAALVSLLSHKKRLSYVLCACVALTKPQAVIYLFPFFLWGLHKHGWRWVLHGVVWGVGVCVLSLVPFIVYGTISSVFTMYTGITDVHQWLTGCAHNLWWLVSPVPPFESDRVPLLFGLNGLEIGLFLFGCLALWLGWCLWQGPSDEHLLEVCALLGFGFFVVVTEIHENHHYAVFAFLPMLIFKGVFFRWAYYILSGTFVINLVTTKLWLEESATLTLVFIRLETLNALINVGVCLTWICVLFARSRKNDRDPQSL